MSCHYGFYDNLEEIKSYSPDADFSFIQDENIGLMDKYNCCVYDFLHGYCIDFANYLSKTYGYPIESIIIDGNLVHSYCTSNIISGEKIFIDVRGFTSNFDEFIQEFADDIVGFGKLKMSEQKEISFSYPVIGTKSGLPDDFEEDEELFLASQEIDEYYKFWD